MIGTIKPVSYVIFDFHENSLNLEIEILKFTPLLHKKNDKEVFKAIITYVFGTDYADDTDYYFYGP